jgi:4-hydroxy-3-methylbut-2-enyl diphosphate reductase
MAYNAAANGGVVYTMGPLIHNPQVLDGLWKQGVGTLDADHLPSSLSGAVVIIRAHGITPALERELEERGAHILDATCPKVKASQMKARSLAEAGYTVFLAGEREHSEIIGIQGYAPSCLIAASPAEAAVLAEALHAALPSAKTALIGQTTISLEEYQRVGEELRRFFPALQVINTICDATRDRQDALKELCAVTDAIIVAGSRSSANTRHLFAIACDAGKPAWLVESASELAAIADELSRFERVGLSAGASTPAALIDEICGTATHITTASSRRASADCADSR